MAVLARSSITLVTSVDIDSVYWFYILQASTAAAPAKPTTVPATKGNPPSGWSTTEPTTVDINKTLYRVELTYFTDGTGVYSSVNQVSSYEAAKVAYNKADTVQTNLDDAYDKLQSMGEQLVVNGNAFMGDNTNFTAWTFDGAVANGTKGSFTKASDWNGTPMINESFPVDITKRYRFEFDAKSKDKTAKHYSFLNFYDVDGNTIYANNHMFIANTLTTLSQELKNGDTVVHLTDLTNWETNTGTATHKRGLTFWNYKNSFGYQYPELTYSRNTWANLYTDTNVNKTAKTITLSSPWTHGTFPAGTKVSQSNSGANYKYNPWSNSLVETEWTHYVGYYDGTDYSGNNVQTKFPPGAATAKVGFLWNYQKQSTTDQLWITNVSVMEDVKTSISNAQTTANNAATAASNAQTTANSAQTTANNAQTTANTANTNASTALTTANTANSNASTALTTANGAKTAADNALINTKYNGPVNIGAAVTANRLIMNTTTAANTAASYKMVAKNTAYNIESPILYSATALSTGNIALADHTCYLIGNVSITGQGGASSLTTNKPVFLKGTLSGSTFTTVNDATFITQTQPTSSDNYHYIFLGTATSTTNVMLQAEHPLYMFIGGSFHRLGSSSDKILQTWVGGASVAIADAKLNGSYIQANTVTADKIYVEDLNALGATIGGFEIGSNSIHTAGSSTSDTAENAIWLCGYASGAEDGFTRSINGTSRGGLVFAIGGSFGVDYDGWIYAANATISGKITATSGEIGNWTIGARQSSAPSSSAETKGSLYTGTFGSAGGIYLIPRGKTTSKTIGGGTATDWRFTIGSKFGVRNDGTLYANGANLTGSITAASLSTTDTLKDQAVNESAFSVYRWDHFVYMSASISFDGFDMYMQSWGQTSNDWRIRDGYRPTKNIWAPVVWGVNGGFKLAAMEIRSDGWINLYGYETYGGAARNLKTAYRAGSGQYGVDGNSTLFFNVMWMTNQTAT